jgi:hypothetical protein
MSSFTIKIKKNQKKRKTITRRNKRYKRYKRYKKIQKGGANGITINDTSIYWSSP